MDLFLVGVGAEAHARLGRMARDLRGAQLSVRYDFRPRSLGAQMRRADRLRARVALILGEAELANGTCTLKRLADGHQESVPAAQAAEAALRLGRAARPGEDK